MKIEGMNLCLDFKMDTKKVFCFDTETTGLGKAGEICQLSIYRLDEKLVFNEFIKPVEPISDEVAAIHGVTNEMVEHMHPMSYWWDYLIKNFFEKTVVIGYNVFYDIRLMLQSMSRYRDVIYFSPTITLDVMMLVADAVNNGKWMSLEKACERLEINPSELDLPYHNAQYDTLMTLKLFKKLYGLE